MSNPVIIGAFEPLGAYNKTLTSLLRLVEAVSEAPDAIPAAEVLRAAQTAIDTLEAITEFAVSGSMGLLMQNLSEDDWNAHQSHDEEVKQARTVEEEMMHKFSLIRRVAEFHEMDMDTGDGEDVPDMP